ncbi:response regulator transcription factor [Streptomyces sp. cg35]|uniref:helix-turn-helix transcriptional regulator n=1 Tax=Streptomyces sp. cg35 TaxID=3421650 RepID=UPI003D17780C
MHYPAAAQFMHTAIPDVIRTYRNALLTVRSPLAMHQEAWPRCRDQARSIVEECASALAGRGSSDSTEARSFSQLVGVDRAGQGIAMAESVRAVDILWSAMQPSLRTAVQYEVAARRTDALLLASTAFRSSTGSRLYAGARAYDAADRLVPARPEVAAKADGRVPGAAAPARPAACAGLSCREREILERVSMARTNGQIARELGIETATVKRHLSNIYGKLQADSRIDAVNKAFGRV